MARRSPKGRRRAGFRAPFVLVFIVALAGAAGLLFESGAMDFAWNGSLAPEPTPAAGEDHPALALLSALAVATPPPDMPDYDRSDWRHWIDKSGNCRNARHETLVAESLTPPEFSNERECTVVSGLWTGPFTGIEVTNASALDIDHMVPLANAHRSGGWAWEAERREAFANDLSYENHLIAVTASANRSKGDKGPEEWRPPLEAYWCTYAVDWVTIKHTWELSVTSAEHAALEEMLAAC